MGCLGDKYVLISPLGAFHNVSQTIRYQTGRRALKRIFTLLPTAILYPSIINTY